VAPERGEDQNLLRVGIERRGHGRRRPLAACDRGHGRVGGVEARVGAELGERAATSSRPRSTACW
jgi:hypothetical protein